MDFTKEQQTKIEHLMESGWPEGMARTAVVAESAGHTTAVEDMAAVVKVLGSEAPSKTKVEAEKKRIREELKAVAGKSDFPSIQKSIGLKRQLAKLG